MRKSVLVVAAASLLALAQAAQAADQATGWKNWSDHAERVVAAFKTGNMAEFDAACIGTTRTIISQGFQFPYWGQMLPQFCGRVQTENQKRQVDMRGWRQECKQLRQVKGALGKASDVAVEPRAKPLADEMSKILEALDVRECSSPPKRERFF